MQIKKPRQKRGFLLGAWMYRKRKNEILNTNLRLQTAKYET